MIPYTTSQRISIVQIYLENGHSIARTQREYQRRYNVEVAPTYQTIKRLVLKFQQSGKIGDFIHTGRRKTGRSDINIELVRASVAASPKTSIRKRSAQLGISRETLRRILTNDLNLFPYKIQSVQRLFPGDYQLRLDYARMFLEIAENNPNFLMKLIMGDEAHFYLDGSINKQNYRFWSAENPGNIHQNSLHPLYLTVWCGISANGIIGPYFFEGDNGITETVRDIGE